MLNETENEKIHINEYGFNIFGKQFKTGICKVVDYPALMFYKNKYRFVFMYKPKLFNIPNISLYYHESISIYVIKLQFLLTFGIFFNINKKPKINPLWLEIFIKLLINIMLLYCVYIMSFSH